MSRNQHPGSVQSYLIGFGASLALSVGAYLAVTEQLASGVALLTIIMSLALVQLIVQMVFFLHLGQEKRPRWNLAAFGFMSVFVLIIVLGSMWIMHNLNYNMTMTPEEINQYMLKQNKKGF